jgi:hypothetical protein
MAVMTYLSPAPLHLGAMHPYEQLLLAVIAFGPFVVLGVVVFLRRRHDLALEERSVHTDPPPVRREGPGS